MGDLFEVIKSASSKISRVGARILIVRIVDVFLIPDAVSIIVLKNVSSQFLKVFQPTFQIIKAQY
jgi:hypothetical protein